MSPSYFWWDSSSTNTSLVFFVWGSDYSGHLNVTNIHDPLGGVRPVFSLKYR